MTLSMPSPWKHPTTGTYYLFQRVPADLASKARGQTLHLSVAGELWPVRAGVHVKVSLRTKDAGSAKVRFREADDSLQLHWSRLRSGLVELSHRQILEIAGAIYREIVADFDQEPGAPEMWAEAILACIEADASEAPTDLPSRPEEEDVRTAIEIVVRNKTEQGLQKRGLNVTEQSWGKLRLQALGALAQAFDDNWRKASGDYAPSPFERRFPLPAPTAKPTPRTGTGPTLTGLFDHWTKAQKQQGKSDSTARRWRPVLASLVAFLGHDDAASVTDDDIIRWRQSILDAQQSSAGTFNRNHIALVRVLYRQENGKVANCPDPTLGLKWRVAKPIQTRPKGFTTDEALAILRAADGAQAAPGKTADVMRRVQQWVPWICAYTGARVGEVTQLRGADVMTIDGVRCIRITPEAGTVKTRKFRDVPLHPHLIEKGFLEFAQKMGPGPMFYSPSMKSETPWGISSIKLAAWVRASAGVTDPRVQPNHGWRHVFKTIGRLAGIDRLYLNGICGQSLGTTEGDRYGDTPMPAVLREIQRFPHWEVGSKTAPLPE